MPVQNHQDFLVLGQVDHGRGRLKNNASEVIFKKMITPIKAKIIHFEESCGIEYSLTCHKIDSTKNQ